MIVSATQVTLWTSISASVNTILSKNYIDIVQERVQLITNNYFCSDDLSLQATVLFNATARSITLDGSTEYWINYGFQAGDDFLIYRSWRNDGVFTINSLLNETLVVISSQSVINERFNNNNGPTVYFSVIKWPKDIQSIACEMIYFDAEIRPEVSANVKSNSFGPFSETYTTDTDEYGYPQNIIDKLTKYKIVRFM
jgi:hypothetical protein